MTDRQRCVDCPLRYAVGRSPRCNPCRKKRSRDSAHNAHLKKTYGITIGDYYAMLESQDGTCAICDGGTSRNYLACDHDHKTGEVRGLLCARCNKVLRDMRDSPEKLRIAADYLTVPPSRKVLKQRDWSRWAD